MPPHQLAEVTGQTIEWMVWTAITTGSAGALHVYLPVRDMGVDAVIRHRLSAANAVAVQVKGRTHLEDGILRIHVQTDEAAVPGTLLISVVADLEQRTLADPAFVIPMDDVRRLGPLVPIGDRQAHAVEVPFPPGTRTHWAQFAVPVAEIAGRIARESGDARAQTAPAEAEMFAKPRAEATGYLGEMALLRHLAPSEVISVFHAAPDDEFVEYIALHTGSGASAQIQVKCVEPRVGAAASIAIRSWTFDPQVGRIVIFTRTGNDDVHDTCFVIPSDAIPALATPGTDRYTLEVNPWVPGLLEKYQLPLGELARHIEALLST